MIKCVPGQKKRKMKEMKNKNELLKDKQKSKNIYIYHDSFNVFNELIGGKRGKNLFLPSDWS